mgnify:CR=1 FL=1
MRAVVGVIYQFNGNSNIRLSEIGDYIGGTVASTWSLAGLFFIYVAFLGQQKQMLLQKLDLYYNRLEITATRKELEGQKEQMIEQNKAIKLQRFENTFFHVSLLLQLKRFHLPPPATVQRHMVRYCPCQL